MLVLFGLAGMACAQAGPAKTVLVLYDGGREFKSIQLTDDGIESALNDMPAAGSTTIFREYLDLTRVNAPGYVNSLRQFYKAKYSNNKPDVIIAIRGRALDFLLESGFEVFPGVPIVSAAMDIRQLGARTLPANVTGNTLQARYWPSVQLALTLRPDTSDIFVIVGASPNDLALESLVREELAPKEKQLRITYLAGLPIDALLKRVSELPPKSALLFVTFAQDGDGRSFLPHQVLPRIAQAASVPTYIASDDVVDLGAVGGDVISFETVGRDSGAIAARILAGASAATIAVTESSVRVKTLDARQLERWGIPLSRVPPGSTIANRQPSIWESYGWWIAGGMLLIVVQAALISTLLVHRRRRRLAESNLLVSEAQGREAVREERDRMARDMHDTLAQGFTGVIVQLEAAQQAVAQGFQADTHSHIQRASHLARQSLGEARRSIRALRPQALENTDLCVALEESLKLMTVGTPLRGEWELRGQPRAAGPLREEHLLRIFQEMLTNALRHSRAEIFRASLFFDPDAIRLEVQDDGIGFGIAEKHEGLGLIGMRERVKIMNGALTIESQIGVGTRICVTLPN